MKLKTNSGAKKRLRALPGGKVKRKKANRRHLLISRKAKRKRHLARGTYVGTSDGLRVRSLLLI